MTCARAPGGWRQRMLVVHSITGLVGDNDRSLRTAISRWASSLRVITGRWGCWGTSEALQTGVRAAEGTDRGKPLRAQHRVINLLPAELQRCVYRAEPQWPVSPG